MAIENSVVLFPCKDIYETSKFYQGVIDMKLIQVQNSRYECHIFNTGYGYLGFCQYPGWPSYTFRAVGICISLSSMMRWIWMLTMRC